MVWNLEGNTDSAIMQIIIEHSQKVMGKRNEMGVGIAI